MNATITSIILATSVILEVVLELKGIKVPAIVYLLSGFAVRHIIGGDTANDAPIPKIEAPKATVAPKTAIAAAPLAVLAICVLFMSGCASYNQKLVCAQVATNNAAIPYVGGQSNGYVTACYYSCLGKNCSKPDDGANLVKAVAAAITQTNGTIITSGPVKITAVPLK